MRLTRRDFVLGSTASLGAMATPALLSLIAPAAQAVQTTRHTLDYSDAFSMLNRLSFGATLQEYQNLTQLGLKKYLEVQLHPVDGEDTDCNARIANATLHIEYKASEPVEKKPKRKMRRASRIKNPIIITPP